MLPHRRGLVEAAALDQARSTLKELGANIASSVVTDQRGALEMLLDSQLATLG
jgi:hypothetical protein